MPTHRPTLTLAMCGISAVATVRPLVSLLLWYTTRNYISPVAGRRRFPERGHSCPQQRASSRTGSNSCRVDIRELLRTGMSALRPLPPPSDQLHQAAPSIVQFVFLQFSITGVDKAQVRWDFES